MDKPKKRTREVNRRRASVKTSGIRYVELVEAIASTHGEMVSRAAAFVDCSLVVRNWLIGANVVQFEQGGADRAVYGENLLPRLASDLAARGVPGCSREMLGRMRMFFRMYPQVGSWIRSPAVTVFSSLSLPMPVNSVTTGDRIPSPAVAIAQTREPVADAPSPLEASEILKFSWSHLIELIRIDDPWKRAFYENECLHGHWSKRQLQRQIESLLYERTGLSTNKKAVVERARKQAPPETIADMLRDPYILEFTGLAERPEYSEDNLESALLDHLQRFLLELGRGFCFEARQFRMTEGRKHHRVDLVFYHRLLRCHVLIDLKIRAFEPADAGQMNFYVNWFKTNMMAQGDNLPVGILLCSDKDGAEVEFATAGIDRKLFVSRYRTALPSAEELKAFLERDRAEIKALENPKA
jgi:predicted nuclease of restriction endonuclease-like (RecB) superfamily